MLNLALRKEKRSKKGENIENIFQYIIIISNLQNALQAKGGLQCPEGKKMHLEDRRYLLSGATTNLYYRAKMRIHNLKENPEERFFENDRK